MKRILLLFTPLFIFGQYCYSQVYIEKQSRHRFAQLNMGLDVETRVGGKTFYQDEGGNTISLPFKSTFTPRFIIGGTHFWGHADFYIAIPLFNQTTKENNQQIQNLRGVETAFKYYPWRIEHHKFRPYIGLSVAPFYHEQKNSFLSYGNGPELNKTNYPLLAGFTFNKKNQLFELGMSWNYANKQDYYIARDQIASIKAPPVYLNVSYRIMLETTLGAEKDWESGRTEKVTGILSSQKKLNGFYVGAGLSSAFWLSESSYNIAERPYINKYNTAIMADFSLGYYFHKPDINLALGYRGYNSSTSAYGSIQSLKRKSLVFEITKYLFDYHGFVPFAGPAISREQLSFIESFEGQKTFDTNENKTSYGITFGWDIRPNRLQSWILRTNLRYFPNLNLEIENNRSISFDNLEFNFIQLIIYPNRMFKKKSKSNKN